jgi:hypothetical protein
MGADAHLTVRDAHDRSGLILWTALSLSRAHM